MGINWQRFKEPPWKFGLATLLLIILLILRARSDEPCGHLPRVPAATKAKMDAEWLVDRKCVTDMQFTKGSACVLIEDGPFKGQYLCDEILTRAGCVKPALRK